MEQQRETADCQRKERTIDETRFQQYTQVRYNEYEDVGERLHQRPHREHMLSGSR